MTARATLVRIRLNPYSREVQRDLRYATEMHRTLMRMVPDDLGDTPRRAAGLMYRLDETEEGGILLVQAAAPLDCARLPAGYGRAETKDMSPVFAALRKGLGVRYRIALNPAKRERLPLDRKGQRGRIVALTGAEADQWWATRAAEIGLHLHTAAPTPLRDAVSRPKDGIKHRLVRYDGTATVLDAELLATAVRSGIGRGKAYGAGLLSLAPAAVPEAVG